MTKRTLEARLVAATAQPARRRRLSAGVVRERRFRYPVVYMQDGQNLSDPVDGVCGHLGSRGDASIGSPARGIEAISSACTTPATNGSPNTARFPIARHGGGEADAYLDVPGRDAEAAHRSHVQHPARSRRDGDPRILDGRPGQPLRLFPLSVDVRPRRGDEPVDLVRAGHDPRLHRRRAHAARPLVRRRRHRGRRRDGARRAPPRTAAGAQGVPARSPRAVQERTANPGPRTVRHSATWKMPAPVIPKRRGPGASKARSHFCWSDCHCHSFVIFIASNGSVHFTRVRV